MATVMVRVSARRFSSAAATTASASETSGPLARLTRMFKAQPIEDLVDMKTLRSVQQLAEQVPATAVASQLTTEGGRSYRAWLQDYQTQKNLTALDQEAFSTLMKDVSAFIQTMETAVLSEKPKISAALGEETLGDDERAVRDAYVEAMKLKLARHKCELVSANFGHLDTDQDGSVTTEEVEKLLATAIEGTADDWLRYQFQVHDTDGDEVVNEAESKQILDAIILTQKTVMAEVFQSHVANLPKKHTKIIAKAFEETNWKERIPEKVRCVFHFAAKEDEENKTIHWETFKENQEIELPELQTMLRVYAKGVYDERYAHHELQEEKRGRRIKGVLLALALGVGDFVFALI